MTVAYASITDGALEVTFIATMEEVDCGPGTPRELIPMHVDLYEVFLDGEEKPLRSLTREQVDLLLTRADEIEEWELE